MESYSGLLTVDAPNNGNMFFWFFPAAENPETAPVVIWLQVRRIWIKSHNSDLRDSHEYIKKKV